MLGLGSQRSVQRMHLRRHNVTRGELLWARAVGIGRLQAESLALAAQHCPWPREDAARIVERGVAIGGDERPPGSGSGSGSGSGLGSGSGSGSLAAGRRRSGTTSKKSLEAR